LIVITHRLASIAWMNRIVVLDQGRMIASGHHNVLHANSNAYRKLYEADPATMIM